MLENSMSICYYIVTMFILRNIKKVGKKEYSSTLLVESVRENGVSRHKTILNLSKWGADEVNALEASLKGKTGFSLDDVKSKEGKNIGGLWVMKAIADRLNISQVLGKSRQAKKALLIILGRILTQGSRLHLCEWGQLQEIESVLGIEKYNEDQLYEALDWLCSNQEKIEHRLFQKRYKGKPPELFLYDITSSYLEGDKNELAKYGYNRDKKKGKKQIVIGLITDGEGIPISVEVFEGNRIDSTTVIEEIEKLAKRFGAKKFTFVGDRGMLKKGQIEHLKDRHHYITAITKPQIEKLLKAGLFQMDLFDEAVTEIEDNGRRYVARRNPYMAKRSGANRLSKIDCLKQKTSDANTYINDHSKAKTETQIKNISALISKFKLNKCIAIKETSNQQLDLVVDQNVLKEMEKLDGCYVLKTDLDSKKMSKENIHARYKDLAMVEHAFRTMKTSVLEVRPIYVRKKSRTRGHVFATMLAYMITQYFWNQVKELGHTLDFSIECVNDIKTTFLILGKKTIKTIPTLSPLKIGILNALNISLPKTIPV